MKLAWKQIHWRDLFRPRIQEGDTFVVVVVVVLKESAAALDHAAFVFLLLRLLVSKKFKVVLSRLADFERNISEPEKKSGSPKPIYISSFKYEGNTSCLYIAALAAPIRREFTLLK